MPRLALTCALITLLISGRAGPTLPRDSLYPQLGQAGLDVTHYDVHLTLAEPGTPRLSSAVTAHLLAQGDLNEIQLDYAGPAVQNATWNGLPVSHARQLNPPKLIIRHALRAGQQAQVRITSAGTVTGRADATLPIRLGWQSVTATPGQPGANFAFSEPDGTHTFLPSNDHPSDPATFTTHLTVPQGVTAAASGIRQSDRSHPDGTHTVTFLLDTPIPTYALGIHIGTLDEVRRPDLQLGDRSIQRTDYFPSSVPGSVRTPYDRTDDMLRTLSDWFGPYPFRSYGSVVVTPAFPALETATLSTMPVRSSRERVIVHEIAHQWFGNAVPLADWSETWLNEGFASYAELLWAEAQGEPTPPLLDGWRARLSSGTRPLIATTRAQLFDATAYARGALALHALRQQVGDAAFRTFLRHYTRTRAGQPTRTSDLLTLTRQQLGAEAAELLTRWAEQPTLPQTP